MDEFTLNMLLSVGGVSVFTTVVVQFIKLGAGDRQLSWPWIALGIGVAASLWASLVLEPLTSENLSNAVVRGVFGGAAAQGLYSLGRTIPGVRSMLGGV